MFIQKFKGGAGRNYHLQDKSLPTPQQVAGIAPHFHNILDRGEVVKQMMRVRIRKVVVTPLCHM